MAQLADSGEFSSPSRLLARDRGQLGRVGRVEDGRQQVELVDRVVDYCARRYALRPRDEGGYAGGAFVERLLPPEPVFAYLVAVVGRVDDYQVVGQTVPLDGIEYAAD